MDLGLSLIYAYTQTSIREGRSPQLKIYHRINLLCQEFCGRPSTSKVRVILKEDKEDKATNVSQKGKP